MNTKYKFHRMFANILSIVVMLAIAFPVTGSVYAQEPAPSIEGFAWYDRYVLVNWTAGRPVEVTIANPYYQADPFVPDDSDGWYAFYPGVDLQPGSVITATNGDITKVLEISPLSATVDANTGIVTGVATANRTFHMRTDGDHFQLPIEQDVVSGSDGNWSATIAEYLPWAWFTRGEMWEGDDDGDVTYAIWHVQQPVVEVWLAQNEIRAFGWPRDTDLVFNVNGIDIGTATTQPVNWFEGTWAVLNAGDYDVKLQPDMEVMVTDGVTPKSTSIQNLKITNIDIDNDLAYGYAPPNADLELGSWEDSPVFRFFNNGDDQNWMVDYKEPSLNDLTVDLNLGDELRLFMRDEEKDATVWGTWASNPFIWADPICECINGWDWGVWDSITIQVFDQDGNPFTLQTPTQTYVPDAGVFFDLQSEGIDLQPGYRIVMTNGWTTKELTVSKLVVKEMNLETNTISGVFDPALPLLVHSENQEPLNYEFNGDQWVAIFDPSQSIDRFGEAYQPDEDGDKTGMGWDGVPGFMRYDIYAFDVANGTVQRITNLDGTGEYDPSWSPNGKRIAHDVVYWDGSHGIFITNVKTGMSTPLVGADDGGNDAAWSPNGKWIAFDRRWYGEPNIYVVPDTGGTPMLIQSDAVTANWAPNSKRVVFQQLSDGSVWTAPIEVGNGEATLIAQNGSEPAWSPDGNWIAYVVGGNIWKVSVNIQGKVLGDPIQVTHLSTWNVGGPTWSLDNQTIFFNGGAMDEFDIWNVSAAGGDPVWSVGAPEAGDYGPENARNGASIAYASNSPDGLAPRQWIAAYTHDAGNWSEGSHNYHYEATWNGGSEITNEISFEVIEGAEPYDGYALLRPGAVRVGPDCAPVDAISPDQPTRFLAGYVTDNPMTYSEALDYFDNLSASAVWDDGQSAGLVRREIIPYRTDNWPDYVCTFTADLILANQPSWVNSGIKVSAGQSFTIEAFGQMNPCSDTYPNGAEYCIFFTPQGAEGVVGEENEFGRFPGPGLRFMALLGRIGDGEPFYVGEGGTFTAVQGGMLWFTPNDNLRTDNQGSYGVLVWLEP